MEHNVPQTHERWQDHNRRGLAFAAAADWGEAADAFAIAAEALASDTGELTPHEPLALVLGNLAQACFRAGRMDEALTHSRRACALRVALTGEDGMPAARARMDLAVILATANHRDEAMALIQRAIAAVERHAGEEDPRLAVVLENAARIALSVGAVANAEPLLLRLHALLALHGESTEIADQLLASIANVRTLQGAPQRVVQQAASQEASLAESLATPHAAHPGDGSTTTLVEAIEVVPPEEPLPPAIAISNTPTAPISESVDIGPLGFPNVTTAEWDDQPLRDAVALTDVLLRTTPSGVPAISSLPEPLVVDFPVHHGLIDETYLEAPPTPASRLELVEDLTLEADAQDGPAPEEPLPQEPAAHEPAPVDASTSPAPIEAVVPASGDAPPDKQASPQRSPRSVAVVLPTPHAGPRAVEATPIPPRPPGMRGGPGAGENGQGMQKVAILAGGVLAAGAVGWWFFLR